MQNKICVLLQDIIVAGFIQVLNPCELRIVYFLISTSFLLLLLDAWFIPSLIKENSKEFNSLNCAVLQLHCLLTFS